MDLQTSGERFDQAVASLSPFLREELAHVPKTAKQMAQEIRLRMGAPIAITCPGQTWFLGRNGELHNVPSQGYRVSKSDIADSIVSMCGHSVHSHQHEMQNGYITLHGGHRAGLVGTAVLHDGEVCAVREITSVNLRIAREICGAADALIRQVFAGGLRGLLLVGPPSSGKTTLLRDLARQLSSGAAGRYYRVAVVDERCEIGAVYQGVAQNHLGPCCDLLSGYPKGEGILTAVRSLSPQVIVCDEIGTSGEVAHILDGLNCGVKIVASAHASSVAELLRRTQICQLIEKGAFDQIAFLASGDTPGKILHIEEAGELIGQAGGDLSHHSVLFHDGHAHGVRFVGKSSID